MKPNTEHHEHRKDSEKLQNKVETISKIDDHFQLGDYVRIFKHKCYLKNVEAFTPGTFMKSLKNKATNWLLGKKKTDQLNRLCPLIRES